MIPVYVNYSRDTFIEKKLKRIRTEKEIKHKY